MPALKKYFFLIPVLVFFSFAHGQNNQLQRVKQYHTSHEQEIISDFISFLSIPNVATDTEHIRKNADFLFSYMRSKGIEKVQLLEGDGKNIPPVVYGEYIAPGATKTIVFYAHYDGQPVNASLWLPGLQPFKPIMIYGNVGEPTSLPLPDYIDFHTGDWRIVARSASDDKAGVMAILQAIDAIKKNSLQPSCNIKFFFEGEEEQGSTHLSQILQKYRSLLQSDLWIICDGPVHQSGYKQLVFGARGDAHVTLKIYGPKNPLHSGHYGNWVPNPVMQLSKLLASMKDDDGRVTIKDFYSDVVPLTATEKQALASIPNVETELKQKIGFASEEMKGKNLQEAINLPSLNINGIESSNVGTIQANVIPISATAVIDLRLVLGNDWKRQQQKLIDHIVAQGFYITDHPPTDEERSKYSKIVQVTRGEGDNARRTSMDWPVAKNVAAALQQTTDHPLLRIPTLGGSLPLDALESTIGARALIVPIANYDNNQHAENENIRLGNFFEGIDMMASIMLMKW